MVFVIDIYSKYAWVITLKDKKYITITNAFQKIFKDSNSKIASQMKYGLIKVVNATINQWNHG